MSGRPVPPRPVPPVGKPKKEKRPLSPEEKRRRARRLRRWLFIAIGVCLLIAAAVGTLVYLDWQRENTMRAEKESHVAQPVDLGLSVKWASWDLGASAPEACGLEYKWGKGADPDLLGAFPDEAHEKWGNWRMPTYDEWKELIENCRWRPDMLHGIHGVRAYGPNGNSIFFPFQAYESGGFSLEYWTANLCNDPSEAWKILQYKDNALDEDITPFLIEGHRDWEKCRIRPVCAE